MMVTKSCPKCQQQVPVACKACPCGHVFFTTRRPISIHKLGESRDGNKEEVKCRRTERVRRERPDYFNALQIENQLKSLQRKARQRGGNSTSSSTNDNDADGYNSEGSSNSAVQHPKRRGRPKGSASGAKKEKREKIEKVEIVEKEEDLFGNVSQEKCLQYSVILAEINRKLSGQQWTVAGS